MSVIEIAGIAWAAGLDWLPRGNPAQTAYEARRGKSDWYAHHGEQTGFVRGSERYSAGMPVLAAALHEAIPEDRWMALLIGDFGGCALIQVNDGVILSDGDRVFASLEEGRAALDGLDKTGWVFFASSRVLEGARGIDVAELPREAGLRRVPLAGVTRRGPGCAWRAPSSRRGRCARRSLPGSIRRPSRWPIRRRARSRGSRR